MKKRGVLLFAVILVAAISLCSLASCAVSQNQDEAANDLPIKQGMTMEEVYEIIPRENWINCPGTRYVFAPYNDETSAIIRFSTDKDCVAEYVNMVDAKPHDKSDFDKLKVGMTVEEVVETVGIPFGTSTYGLATNDFTDSDGKVYTLTWYLGSSSEPFTTRLAEVNAAS